MRLILVVGLISACYGLYEDQIGKFDWRKQYVGCPEKAIFYSTSKSEQIIVSSRENIFASLSAANGDINWRRIQENHQGSSLQLLPSGSKRLYSVSDGGRAVRAWNAVNGALVWQKSVCDAISSSTHLAVSKNANQEIVAYGCGHVFTFSSAGDELSKVYVGTSEWSRVVSEGGNIYHISISNGALTVNAISGGKVAAKKTLSIKSNNGEKCHLIGNHVVCSHSDDVFSINVAADNLVAESIATGISIRDIIVLDDNHVVVRSSQDTIILSLQSGLKQVLKIQKRVEAVSFVANKVVSIISGMISVYDLSNGKEVFVKPLPTHTTNAAQAISLFANERKQNIELLIVFADCRTELLEISLTASTLESEWHREEGLARVASVEMVDLPLSEQQQLIEDEFDQEGDNMISSLIHRTVSQLTQLQRWFINSIHQIVTLSGKLSGKTSFSQIMDTIKSSSKATSAGPLERDFFNLRKMLVVASLDGVIFGIDSADGSVVWKTYLGSSFTPLSNSLGEIKVPLFIQRSTANYHLQGQAAVVFKDSFSHRSVLVFFNPITGVVAQRKVLDSAVKRVDMLPFIGKDHIHSLIVVDENDKVSFHPELPSDVDVSYPVFILSHSNTAVEGKQVNLRTGALETLWNANLHLAPTEKIIIVKGKPASQRVHSQGRVLIDRNVQYKYSNPNLVVVASLDSSAQLLTIYLLDSVSGQIVHTAKLQKAGGPVHLVHCENWIAYSYWSEKARRTEIGIIELYEGDIQSNKGKFDSLSPTERAPEVTSQSYVYAQGVDAMAVTETEQGLTTRAIVLALPFGGIHEVSRKFLDANRPLELTQEMREEMMIPYMPEIPIATEEMVNYNQTVFRVRGIKTAMSGLESTSLMLAYGVDLFFTRLHPSGTFDILKDDFDHVLISLVLLGLFVGSFISKRIARNNALKASWA